MAVVQKLANIGAAAAHLFEPGLGDATQLIVWLGEPGFDIGVAPVPLPKPPGEPTWAERVKRNRLR